MKLVRGAMVEHRTITMCIDSTVKTCKKHIKLYNGQNQRPVRASIWFYMSLVWRARDILMLMQIHLFVGARLLRNLCPCPYMS